jgi:hypothetical protein
MRGSGFVVLPGHKSQRVGLKITLDAASIRRAKKGHKHWTTVVMQLLCVGVEQGWWGRTGANNQFENAQSPKELSKVCVWNDKDNHHFVALHVKPMLKQLLAIEDESLLTSMPPKVIRLPGKDHQDTAPVTLGLRWYRNRVGTTLPTDREIEVQSLRDALATHTEFGQK